MGRWYAYYERDPNRAKDPKKRGRIYEAKLIHEIGGNPTTSQLILIRTLVPLIMKAEARRKFIEETGRGFVDNEYQSLQAQIANTMGQIRNSTKPATAKRKEEAAPESEEARETGLDLGAVLNVQDS